MDCRRTMEQHRCPSCHMQRNNQHLKTRRWPTRASRKSPERESLNYSGDTRHRQNVSSLLTWKWKAIRTWDNCGVSSQHIRNFHSTSPTRSLRRTGCRNGSLTSADCLDCFKTRARHPLSSSRGQHVSNALNTNRTPAWTYCINVTIRRLGTLLVAATNFFNTRV